MNKFENVEKIFDKYSVRAIVCVTENKISGTVKTYEAYLDSVLDDCLVGTGLTAKDVDKMQDALQVAHTANNSMIEQAEKIIRDNIKLIKLNIAAVLICILISIVISIITSI